MNPPEKPAMQTSERRRHQRRASQSKVRLTVESREIEGQVENISRSGLLFFSEGDLRVSVQIEENGATSKRTGRLVRAQRMRGESFGWAVEFD
jgi:hypothetical protein